MSQTRVIVLRTHQALWSKKRAYGLTEEGNVIEFHAPAGISPTMYMGGLMQNTQAALSGGFCFGVPVDDAQIARRVASPMNRDEAGRLFQKTMWPDSEDYPPRLDPDDMQLIVRATKTF